MRVTVTGGAGFIGANLVIELVRRHHQVVVLDDLSTGLRSNLAGTPVELLVGSILDPEALAAACAGADSVVHLAAVPSVARSLADPRRSHDTNATGTLAVLEAARATGAHVVVASSSSVYGNSPGLPRSEELPCRPASPYAAGKLAAEGYALAYRAAFGLDCVAFRLFNVFGPGQRADHAYAAVIPRFVDAALRSEPVTVDGDGEQSRDFTYVDTAVAVLADTVQRRLSAGDPVNLAFGNRTTVNETVVLLSVLLGRPIEVVHGPPRPGDVRHSQASGESMRALFPSIAPVPVKSGLRRTVEWMRSALALTGPP